MIHLQGVTFSAESGAAVLSGAAAVFPPGCVSTIIGAAGSGKTLLLLGILGDWKPTQGTIRVNGVDPVQDGLGLRRQICFIARGAPLWPHLTVMEHVRLLVAVAQSLRPSDDEIVHALRVSDFPDRLLRRRAGVLTGLERLLVWLAVHRLRQTAILLADDPAADLSASDAADAGRLIREGMTEHAVVVAASRDPGFARAVGDQAFRLQQGRLEPITRHGDPDETTAVISSERAWTDRLSPGF